MAKVTINFEDAKLMNRFFDWFESDGAPSLMESGDISIESVRSMQVIDVEYGD